MPTHRANGYDIAYVEAGQDEPVMLVHGSLSDCRGWAAQTEEFGRAVS